MFQPFALTARAKGNLALHVLGRRVDGYHELDSIVAFAGVGDQIGLLLIPYHDLDGDNVAALVLGGSAALLQWLASRSPDRVESVYVEHLYPALTRGVAAVSGLLPVSLAECLLGVGCLAALVASGRGARALAVSFVSAGVARSRHAPSRFAGGGPAD